MKRVVVLLDERLDLSAKFRVALKVLQVEPSPKHPEGIKVSFTLVDAERGCTRLVIDNHAPFGFHAHTDLPLNKNTRRALKTKDYREALDEFWRLVKEITDYED